MGTQTTRSSKNTRPARKRRKGITYRGQKTTHDTDGLAGYPAVDLFAPPGTPFLAPEHGKVVRLSGRGGTTGQVFGWSVYFKGDSGRVYFITHLNSKRAPLGVYRAGAVLGTVSRWAGGATHAHVGISGLDKPAVYGDYSSQPQESSATRPGQQQPNQASPIPSLVPPPNAPPLPSVPVPGLPGEGDAYQPKDPAEAWRMIANQPLSSPEAQRWARLMGGNV